MSVCLEGTMTSEIKTMESEIFTLIFNSNFEFPLSFIEIVISFLRRKSDFYKELQNFHTAFDIIFATLKAIHDDKVLMYSMIPIPSFSKKLKLETLESLTADGEYDDDLTPLLVQHDSAEVFKMAFDFLISKTSNEYFLRNAYKIKNILYKHDEIHVTVFVLGKSIPPLEDRASYLDDKCLIGLQKEEQTYVVKYCSECGDDYKNETSRFCSECGIPKVRKPTGVTEKFCLYCGHKFVKGMFCSECGFNAVKWLVDQSRLTFLWLINRCEFNDIMGYQTAADHL
ncbi:hypothetical protein GIB67_016064 [Kingdonia uniflora]|uniref:Uncharacterized protein n=1 Tax=Kingdonia uniflora TaxID=39325 RepID=A0A7J7L206_9MAGN|nr:hypothetical protein GIB67_016064 [Kingdonia uniflora]